MDELDLTAPVLPYAGTSGWSGTDTSADRARRNDSDGTTRDKQTAALRALNDAGWDGLTWRELAAIINAHHGTASGVLSVLHKEGLINRLTERRDRCKVYVLPSHTHWRSTEPHGSTKRHTCPNCGHVS